MRCAGAIGAPWFQRAGVFLSCVTALVLAGCGSGERSGGSSPEQVGPVTVASEASADTGVSGGGSESGLPVRLVDDAGIEVTIDSAERIIPVDGNLAEIVFALGLGPNVVATDLSATYPAEADALPEIGYQRALNAEPIAAFEPTVVLATDLTGPSEVIDQLRSLGIPVVVIERQPTLEGPAAKVRSVAAALGVPDRGEALALAMEAEIEAALVRAENVATRPRALVLYLRGDAVQVVFGAGTGMDALLPAVGATDVAAELGIVDTRPVTAEALVQAVPEVLIVSESGLESVGGIDGLLAIPGMAETPAGEARRILAYDDQLLFGGGPRFGQLMAQLTTDLHSAAGDSGDR